MGSSRAQRTKPQKELQLGPAPSSHESRGTKRSDSYEPDFNKVRDDGPSKVPRRKYKRHPKPDPNAPERPLTAYVRFAKDRRREYEGKSLTFSDLAKQIGVEWQELDAESKNRYLADASEDWTDYRKALNRYQNSKEHADYVAYLHEFAKKNPNSNIKPPYADIVDGNPAEDGHEQHSPASDDSTYQTSPTDPYQTSSQFDEMKPSPLFPLDPVADSHSAVPRDAQVDPYHQLQTYGQQQFQHQSHFYNDPNMFTSSMPTGNMYPQNIGPQPIMPDQWQSHLPSLNLNTSATTFNHAAKLNSASAGSGNQRLREALSKAFNSRTTNDYFPDSGISSAAPSLTSSDFSAASQDFFLPHMGFQLPSQNSYDFVPNERPELGYSKQQSQPMSSGFNDVPEPQTPLDDSFNDFITSDVQGLC